MPSEPQPIFQGTRYTAFAIGPKNLLDCGEATVSGNDESGKPFRLTVKLSRTVNGSLLRTMAARMIIEDLTLKSLSGDDKLNSEELGNAVELLSLEHNLLSDRTAFVCIEERELSDWRKLTPVQRRQVPLLGDRHGGDVPTVRTIAMQAGGVDEVDCSMFARAMSLQRPDDVTDSGAPKSKSWGNYDVPDALEAEDSDRDPLQTLLDWQSFDGSFALNDKFCQFTVALQENRVIEIADAFLNSNSILHDCWISLSSENRSTVVATIVALGYLLTQLNSRKSEWDLIANKAVLQLKTRLQTQSRMHYEKVARSLMSQLH